MGDGEGRVELEDSPYLIGKLLSLRVNRIYATSNHPIYGSRMS